MQSRIYHIHKLWSSRFFLEFLGRAEPEQIRDYLGTLEEDRNSITKSIADFVIYTEGSIPWETAWNIALTDQTVLLESFTTLMDAKSGKKSKDVMTQEMIPDSAPELPSEE